MRLGAGLAAGATGAAGTTSTTGGVPGGAELSCHDRIARRAGCITALATNATSAATSATGTTGTTGTTGGVAGPGHLDGRDRIVAGTHRVTAATTDPTRATWNMRATMVGRRRWGPHLPHQEQAKCQHQRGAANSE